MLGRGLGRPVSSPDGIDHEVIELILRAVRRWAGGSFCDEVAPRADVSAKSSSHRLGEITLAVAYRLAFWTHRRARLMAASYHEDGTVPRRSDKGGGRAGDCGQAVPPKSRPPQVLQRRFAEVEHRLAAGRVSICRGERRLVKSEGSAFATRPSPGTQKSMDRAEAPITARRHLPSG